MDIKIPIFEDHLLVVETAKCLSQEDRTGDINMQLCTKGYKYDITNPMIFILD